MALQTLIRATSDPTAGPVLEALTVEIETAISDLRSTIYPQTLDPVEAVPNALSDRIAAVIHDAVGQLTFTPTTAIGDDLDGALGRQIGHHLVAVLREALTNIARHAMATAAHITLTTNATGTAVELVINDNGRGLPDHFNGPTSASGHGMTTMADRAQTLGGTFSTAAATDGGTIVRWTVPTGQLREESHGPSRQPG